MTLVMPMSTAMIDSFYGPCQFCQSNEFESSGENGRYKTTCGHLFHKKCINKWYAVEQSCPTCSNTNFETKMILKSSMQKKDNTELPTDLDAGKIVKYHADAYVDVDAHAYAQVDEFDELHEIDEIVFEKPLHNLKKSKKTQTTNMLTTILCKYNQEIDKKNDDDDDNNDDEFDYSSDSSYDDDDGFINEDEIDERDKKMLDTFIYTDASFIYGLKIVKKYLVDYRPHSQSVHNLQRINNIIDNINEIEFD